MDSSEGQASFLTSPRFYACAGLRGFLYHKHKHKSQQAPSWCSNDLTAHSVHFFKLNLVKKKQKREKMRMFW